MASSTDSDGCVLLVVNHLSSLKGSILIVADEHWSELDWYSVRSMTKCSLNLISNRWEVHTNAKAAGLDSLFSDFNFSQYSSKQFDSVVYRVSKERATTHHVINQAARVLKFKASLYLSGKKNEGIKNYVKQSSNLLGHRVQAKKTGSDYFASIKNNSTIIRPLPDNNYARLRALQSLSEGKYLSKPGIFGWDKIDRGSAFLIDNLADSIRNLSISSTAVLDLGCGYGYIACEASNHNFKYILATDNNAAAIAACQENFERLLKVNYDVIASDAGNTINRVFDLILCNPPFHQGFSVRPIFISKFLHSTSNLLTKSGKAIFVVNKFIPIEKIALNYFSNVSVIKSNDTFKLVQLN
ncbi:MAG: class I SAM-dependent methyltransferase [Cellvibrionales bacterium TMED148]|nr:rRNA methyltransferase [Porticoccaceae bacterium]RPG88670.1 MAG: class I SAM-dependent methyltransferase [Cellvibrionales bacterium TMED148]